MVASLESIGFYTLSNERARTATATSPLHRCELLLTNRCNFRCPYCRSVGEQHPDLTWTEACDELGLWMAEGLRNVRLSGGEPLLWPRLEDLVRRARRGGVDRIAVSSNGSGARGLYERLLAAGVDDWSISLDACCAGTGDAMAGDVSGARAKVVDNIRFLAKQCYVTVGVVLTERNAGELTSIVQFAHDLGVADIRIITAAQSTVNLRRAAAEIPVALRDQHPILRYRVENLRRGRAVRGMEPGDSPRCALVLDDMAVRNGQHYPCIIYLREGGKPIGPTRVSMREARVEWFARHDSLADPICRKNCLDVCVDYNNCWARGKP